MAKYNRKGWFKPALPPGLEKLLDDYRRHCQGNGLRSGAIAQYEKLCRWFLKNLSDCGCAEPSEITASRVVTACLALTSNSYLATMRTFLRYCADGGQTDRDYSYVIPPYKRPQPLPSVYSEEEIRRMEKAINRSIPVGKREYLFKTREIGSGDLTFKTLDFETINGFLNWIEQERGCGIATRNQRLTALSSFASYAQNRTLDAAVFANAVDNCACISYQKQRGYPVYLKSGN